MGERFDQRLEYQIGAIFMADGPGLPVATVTSTLPEHFAVTPDGSTLGVRFRDPAVDEVFVARPGGMTRTQRIQWNGVWRMSLTSDRLDVFLRPLEVEVLTGRLPTFDEFLHRVGGAFVKSLGTLREGGFFPHRLVAVVSGHSSAVADPPSTVMEFARRYGGDVMAKRAEAGELIDLAFRTDSGGSVQLGTEDVRLHRLENVGTQLTYGGPEGLDGQVAIHAQWDFNTAPTRDKPFDLEVVPQFFEAAREWISARKRHFEGA